jgi:hypothetical protein
VVIQLFFLTYFTKINLLLQIILIFCTFYSCSTSNSLLYIEEQKSIAVLYPGDKGIEFDKRVVFYENFENKSLDDIIRRWGDAKHIPNLMISDETPSASSGLHSLKIKNNGHLYTHFKGIDTLFARFYVKFHKKTGYPHHLVSFQADSKPTPWPKGGAGRAPEGDEKFTVAIEPFGLRGRADPPGIWTFYSYWHDMTGGWGNRAYESFEQINPDQWNCVEVMIKANSAPDKKDGEQAFWIDGELKGHFTNIWWRTSDDLKLNTVWLSYYVTERNMLRNRDHLIDERIMEIWFDDIVVATNYIGPTSSE